jgi:hypothetical protein
MKMEVSPMAVTLNKWWFAALIAPLALAGCQYNETGRIGTTDTTRAEVESAKVLPTAMIEFSDRGARELMADLRDTPRLRDIDGKTTILIGDLNNRTQVTSTNDFEMMTVRLKDNLINSDYARKHLRFVEDRERMRDLARKAEVGSQAGYEGPAPFDPANTFVLNGDFYRISRGEVNQYYMRFSLNHFKTGEQVNSYRYDIKQVKQD